MGELVLGKFSLSIDANLSSIVDSQASYMYTEPEPWWPTLTTNEEAQFILCGQCSDWWYRLEDSQGSVE